MRVVYNQVALYVAVRAEAPDDNYVVASLRRDFSGIANDHFTILFDTFRLLDNLQEFLLELGRGCTFVGRQYRITIDNEHYKVDLVFYHRFLRGFVSIDLKIDKGRHYDIGQMNRYLDYFAKEEYFEGDNPPIGIILTRQRDELLVEFATYGLSSQLFVSKYQRYLPNEAELRAELEEVLKR